MQCSVEALQRAADNVWHRYGNPCRPGAKGIGFEVEPAVFDLTRRNIAHLDAPIELALGSYKELVGTRKDPADHRVVVESGGCSY